jgi:hypothetical protein
MQQKENEKIEIGGLKYILIVLSFGSCASFFTMWLSLRPSYEPIFSGGWLLTISIVSGVLTVIIPAIQIKKKDK